MARTKKAAAPKATFTKVETVAPANRKGSSTCDNPVGVTWVTCLNLIVVGEPLPARKDMHVAVMAEGVAYYTARTQVQRFRRWFADGALPEHMPRGVSIG